MAIGADREDFARLLLSRVVEGAVGPSALRNQGSRNVVARARSYLRVVDYHEFAVASAHEFQRVLDKHTERPRRQLPPGGRHWGSARKALNLVLRDILYSRYLCRVYGFARVESWLELPLDSYVAKGIRKDTAGDVPRWEGIKHLTPEHSADLQNAAREIARKRRLASVHPGGISVIRNGSRRSSPRARASARMSCPGRGHASAHRA